jgi:cell division protein FtsZ
MTNPDDKNISRSKVALWGIGGWGIRIVNSIQPEYCRQVKVVALDTDMQSLVCSTVSSKISIGEDTTCGLGSGGDIEKAEQAFHESEDKIRTELSDCKVLLIVGGIGGGVGSGVIPLLCEYASQENIFTMVFISRPFEFEGNKKICFQQARKKIEASACGLAWFSLDRLVGRVGDETLHDEVFYHCDSILKESVECVIAYLSSSHPGGGDYASLNNLLSHPGETVMGSCESVGPEDLIGAIKGAISALSLSASELESARGFLVHFESGDGIPFRGIEKALGFISGLMGAESSLLYTITRNQARAGKITVRVIAAGIPEKKMGGGTSNLRVALTNKPPPGKQTTFDFNKFTRGVFAETDPTLNDGEDLDIPTYVRKGISLD